MVLAAKTGWTESYIRWELPLSRGYAYFHCARLMEGDHTFWPGCADPLEDWIDRIRTWAVTSSSSIVSNRSLPIAADCFR